ncbi:MAG: glycosyltransferase family 2 protein [Deltaproteobacteria bacterium]|nr:glycosyltransferase family 2 protein [Deltaproteobacteria bacterium]
MKLSVIIPTYNEAKTLPAILRQVIAVPVDKEIIIVDDGSGDQTPSVLDMYKDNVDITILRHQRNMGKGRAIRSAINHVTGDIVIIQDADLEYDPSDYVKLIRPIEEGEAETVYGVRTGSRHSYLRYYLGGKMLSILASFLFGQWLKDISTCYKVFKAELIHSIPFECSRFDFDFEITAKILKRGIRIKEVPIRYYPRSFTEGKKIRWTDGIMAAWTLCKYRFAEKE